MILLGIKCSFRNSYEVRLVTLRRGRYTVGSENFLIFFCLPVCQMNVDFVLLPFLPRVANITEASEGVGIEE
jgi:hypothetical protein